MIRFPRMHIAQSVVNRILNTRDELDANAEIASLPEPTAAPDPVDPTIEGATLDVALQQPSPPVQAPAPEDSTAFLQQGILKNVAS